MSHIVPGSETARRRARIEARARQALADTVPDSARVGVRDALAAGSCRAGVRQLVRQYFPRTDSPVRSRAATTAGRLRSVARANPAWLIDINRVLAWLARRP